MTVRFSLERTWLAMDKSNVVCNWSDFFAGRCLNFSDVIWLKAKSSEFFRCRLNKGAVVWVFLHVVVIKAKSSDLIVNGKWPTGSFQVMQFICQDVRFLPGLHFIGQSLIILNKNKQNYASVINQTQSFSAKMGMGHGQTVLLSCPPLRILRQLLQ